MTNKIIYTILSIIVLTTIVVGVILNTKKDQSLETIDTPNSTSQETTIDSQPNSSTTPLTPASTFNLPIADFQNRITKKPFGIFITPKNSPVQPENFTGYHTGTDVEYQDISIDVPVYAIADGVIILSRTASGYGGVEIVKIDINGTAHSILYGHIRPSSLTPIGTQIKKGQQIGLLGTGYSAETDGERRHLHLAVLSDDRVDVKGYVNTKTELSKWMDPVSLY